MSDLIICNRNFEFVKKVKNFKVESSLTMRQKIDILTKFKSTPDIALGRKVLNILKLRVNIFWAVLALFLYRVRYGL